jgi:phage-related minor tail protein
MADRIKGITVEIGGDTTGLSKALAGVNKEIRDTQSQLKDVNKLLKLDPTNSTLIEQKFKLLGQSVDDTKKKLNDLKSVQNQMDAGLKNGSVTQQQYDAWQREIVATEQELKNLEKECKTTDSSIAATLKQAGSKMQEVGGKISDAGEGITKGVTVPIVAIGTASLAAFKEVDDGLDTVEEKTGASGEALDGMNQIVKDLATSIPTDFQTAGAAVGEVNTRFKLTGDALSKLSGQFIKFAQLNNTDVSTSIDNVSGVLNAFGQDSSNAGDLLDALNATGQATGIDMGTLASSLQLNAVQLKEMGLNSQQAAGFMGMVEMSGLDTSAAMMGLKTAMKNATKDGQTLDQAIAKFSETMKGNGSETEKLQAAYDLFGSKAGAAIYNAASTGKLNLENLSGSLGNFSGSVENTFNETLDPIDQFQMSMNSLKETGADIGNSLATVLAPVLKDISGALKTFSEIWNSIPEPVQNTIVKIALLAATIGPVLVAGGKVISAVGTITSAIGSLTTFLGIGTAATTAAGTAATATGAAVGAASIPLLPIIGIIAAIIAAVIAIIAIVKNWGAITDWFKGVWSGFCDGIQTAWTAVGDFFTQTLPNFFSDVGQKWSDGWNTMKTNAGTIWDNIKTGVGNSIDNIKTNVGNGLDNVKQSFSDKLSAAHGTAASIMENIRGAFSDKMSAARDGVSNAIDAIKGFFNFDWHLPEIKLPHFSIEGSFSLDPPSIPHIGVSWYKKAMGDGMILSSPTIFGAQSGQLLAGGEAGPEAVVGVGSLSSMIQNAVAAQTGSITAAIASALAGAGSTGDITIPVYIGNEHIDTLVVKASQRVNYRSGGR